MSLLQAPVLYFWVLSLLSPVEDCRCLLLSSVISNLSYHHGLDWTNRKHKMDHMTVTKDCHIVFGSASCRDTTCSVYLHPLKGPGNTFGLGIWLQREFFHNASILVTQSGDEDEASLIQAISGFFCVFFFPHCCPGSEGNSIMKPPKCMHFLGSVFIKWWISGC